MDRVRQLLDTPRTVADITGANEVLFRSVRYLTLPPSTLLIRSNPNPTHPTFSFVTFRTASTPSGSSRDRSAVVSSAWTLCKRALVRRSIHHSSSSSGRCPAPPRVYSLERIYGNRDEDVAPGAEKFLLMDGQTCLLKRPGHRDLWFTIPLRAAAMQAADAGQDVDEIDFPQMI